MPDEEGRIHDERREERFRELMDKADLTQSEREVIESRWLRPFGIRRTRPVVAAERGVTRQRVEHLENRALAKMREVAAILYPPEDE